MANRILSQLFSSLGSQSAVTTELAGQSDGAASPSGSISSLLAGFSYGASTPSGLVTVGTGAPTPDTYISSTDSWQTAINNAGTGAVIGMNAGTYTGFAVNPLASQKFVAVGSVILNGNGAGEAFSGHSAQRYVEIWGEDQLRFTGYTASDYHGCAACTLNGDWYGSPTNLAGGWKVTGVTIDNCSGWAGIVLDGKNAEFTNFVVHDIAEVGFKVQTGDDCYIGQGEVYNIAPTNWGNEGGGSKCWNTLRLTFEDIYVHDITDGVGLWTDNHNQDTTYDNITVEAVDAIGIFHEISGGCEIKNCTITGDGSTQSLEVYSQVNDGIKIANSGKNTYGGDMDGAYIHDNVITDCYVGIAFLDQERTDQFSNDLTNGTKGSAVNNTLDNCPHSGDQMDHAPQAYTYGELDYTGPGDTFVDQVTWSGNTLLNGSVIH